MILEPTGAGLDELAPGKVKIIPVEFIKEIRSFDCFDPQMIASLVALYQHLGEQIEQATFPNVVKGIRATGIHSGYGQNSLVAEAKVKFGPAVVNLEALEQEFNVALAHCVQHVIEEPLPIWGRTKWGFLDATLDPDDIQDLQHVVVTVNPKLPTDRANEIAIMQVLRAEGLIDDATSITDYAGYTNPGEMLERVAADRAMKSPEVQRVINLAAIMENGYFDYLVEAAKKIGMPMGQLLNILGLGSPQQQQGTGNPQQQYPQGGGAGQPANPAAQMSARPAAPSQSTLGQPNKAQPNGPLTGSITGAVRQAQTAGTPSNIRNRAVPGIPIGQ